MRNIVKDIEKNVQGRKRLDLDMKCPHCKEWFRDTSNDYEHEYVSDTDNGARVKCGKCGSISSWDLRSDIPKLNDNVVYDTRFFVDDNTENWENGNLGCDERFVQLADDSINNLVDEAAKNGNIKWEDEDEY